MTTLSGRNEAERTLGAAAVGSLRARRLLRRISAPGRLAVSGERDDRVAAAISGLALGDALAAWSRSTHDGVPASTDVRRWMGVAEAAPVTATTQGFVLSAEVWCAAGWAAPVQLSDRLAALAGTMRRPGRAVHHAVAARRAGASWFEAASGSHGDAAAGPLGRRRPGPPRRPGRPRPGRLARRRRHPRRPAERPRRRRPWPGSSPPSSSAPRASRPVTACATSSRRWITARCARCCAPRSAPTEVPPTGSPDHGVRPRAFDVLALAVWCALLSDEPDTALATAVRVRRREPLGGRRDRRPRSVRSTGAAALPARGRVRRGRCGLRRARPADRRRAGRPGR